MQPKQHLWRAWRTRTSGRSSALWSGLAALLAIAALAALWGTAQAAPQTGTTPTLDIDSVNGATLTVDGHNWQSTTEITLGYSPHSDCTQDTGLPDSARATDAGGNFHTTYTMPNSVHAGTYYLCATGLQPNGASITVPSPQQMIVDSSGMVTLPIGSATPTPTNTVPVPTDTVPPGAPTSTPAPGASATSTRQATGPGNQGVSTTPPKSSVSTLVAIIILCLLVFALLVYLVYMWLRGRQSARPPAGGGRTP